MSQTSPVYGVLRRFSILRQGFAFTLAGSSSFVPGSFLRASNPQPLTMKSNPLRFDLEPSTLHTQSQTLNRATQLHRTPKEAR